MTNVDCPPDQETEIQLEMAKYTGIKLTVPVGERNKYKRQCQEHQVMKNMISI